MSSHFCATVHFGSNQDQPERHPRFQKVVFAPSNRAFGGDYRDSADFAIILRSKASSSQGALILIVQGWPETFLSHFKSVLPEVPVDGFELLNTPQPSAMLPVISTERSELYCMTEYIDVHKEGIPSSNLYDSNIGLGDAKIRRLPIVIVTRYHKFGLDQPSRPIVVIGSSEKDDIAEPIIRRFEDKSKVPWDRLTSNQSWIYHDLHFLFNKWDKVYSSAKLNLYLKTADVQGRGATTSILEQTQQLHTDTDTLMGLRELLRIHHESMDIIAEDLSRMPTSTATSTEKWQASSELCQRLQRSIRLFKYFEVTATEVVEQQRNLLSLAFSLETVLQGQAVARLNALAFIFLPLSFVASIFGITTFTASPKWYPAAALPVLLATIAIAWMLNRLLLSTPTKQRQIRRQPKQTKPAVRNTINAWLDRSDSMQTVAFSSFPASMISLASSPQNATNTRTSYVTPSYQPQYVPMPMPLYQQRQPATLAELP